MKKLAVTFAIAVTFLLVNPGTAYGQDTEVVNVSVTIPQVLVLDVNSNAIAYGTVNQVDVGTTVAGPTSTQLSFRGNVSMSLSVNSPATFTGGGGAKPATDLAWSAVPAGIGLANNAGTMGASTSLFAGLAAGDYPTEITVSYGLDINWDDPPGTYDLDVTYTLSTP